MQLMTVSPPYIRFETRAVKQYKPAEEGGTVFFKDVDYALVTSHGSKDTVEKALPDWFTHLESEVRQDRLPPPASLNLKLKEYVTFFSVLIDV